MSNKETVTITKDQYATLLANQELTVSLQNEVCYLKQQLEEMKRLIF